MAIWCFKCTNDSRQSFTLRTWLVQSAFSSSFQRASACSGGKNQFRLGQTWMKIRQKTMQNSWFYMCYQCLQATLLPSYSWISCQVSQNVRLGQETNLLLTCQTCPSFPLISCIILQSVGVCLQPIKSRCLQTKQPKFKQTHHCWTSWHLSRYLWYVWYVWYLWYLYLSHLHHLGSWQVQEPVARRSRNRTNCLRNGRAPRNAFFSRSEGIMPMTRMAARTRGDLAESWHHTSDAAIEHFFEDLEVWSSLIPRYL